MKVDWRKIGIKELAAIVSCRLNEEGIDSILVGGACVSIYTKNKYLSSDLDFVSSASIKEISSALSELGFERKSSRHFEREGCPFFIEFVPSPAAIGSEPIKGKNVVKTRGRSVFLLTPTDRNIAEGSMASWTYKTHIGEGSGEAAANAVICLILQRLRSNNARVDTLTPIRAACVCPLGSLT